jgi:hypothetical protein
MRNIIYITGITASGKTTLAQKLADHLGLPFVKADDVYSMIGRELHYDKPEKLVMPEAWDKFPKFGLLKLKYYKELIKDISGDFIIEGFPLFFEQDRQLLTQAAGEHTATIFRLNLPFDVWQNYAGIKFGGSHIKRDFDHLNSFFEEPAAFYTISNPDILFTHYEKYQRDGFTDKKWDLLKLGEVDLLNRSVIDLGCNEGWIGRNCLNLMADNVTGVDYNWRYLEIARSQGLHTELADLDDYEFKKAYDVVIFLAAFHYVRDKELLLEKIAKNTKEMFILEIPVAEDERPILLLHDTGKCKYFIPSLPLILFWLNKYFARVDYWPSVAPDNSKRLIFKCYK